MGDHSEEAMRVLADYIIVSDKCANEPDETYGAAFIALGPLRERLSRFYTKPEFEAIIFNKDEIRDVLRGAGLIGGGTS